MEVSLQHVFILVLSLCNFLVCANAQWKPLNPSTYEEMNRSDNFRASLSFSVSCVSIAIFLYLFFKIRARFFPRPPYIKPLPKTTAEAIQRCPTFGFSEMKELSVGNAAEECAVCLVEFEDSDTVKLLPLCQHVFHQHCIDQWLPSRLTCPICRQKLISDDTEANVTDVPSEQEREEEEEDEDGDAAEFTEVAIASATEQAEDETEADNAVG
ncbi:RING-H2 finger protein ATL79-like [Vigna unguiculata]|uniref:RING-type E3 ubiquitin transferase n=1 Tax=Vigna unguiculata TaxID=3917 RepID=A0A4D6NLU6_VIGUN|nr:RING-H2 finger protein ATL79-like [Vigna unguiculata]QCE13155.1 E3 ubiquitin-protein ligase [Vigna unguiculata]